MARNGLLCADVPLRNYSINLLHASFALKDSHRQWSSITDFSVVQQLMPEHLHTYELS